MDTPTHLLIERCRICETPLEEGFITGRDLSWNVEDPREDPTAPTGEGAAIGSVSASRCPVCQVGVFSYEA